MVRDNFGTDQMPDERERRGQPEDEGLDEESVRLFEASYARYRKAMDRLAEL